MKFCKPHERNKKHQNAIFIGEKLKTKSMMFSLFHFFNVICKISNFDMWAAKHLGQASCTELTLSYVGVGVGLLR